MPANGVAENVLGTIVTHDMMLHAPAIFSGTICWTVQLIPQVWKSWRSKTTEGLSPWLVWLWGISGPFLGVYVIVQDLNIPLILQPHLFASLCFVSWAQCLYYDRKYSKAKALAAFLAMMTVVAGFEAGMIFAIKASPAYNAGNTAPVKFFGIMSAVIISLALLPQYYEIYKHKEVIGISTTFMLVDCLGGVFSDLSLAFKDKFDVIAAITYSLVVNPVSLAINTSTSCAASHPLRRLTHYGIVLILALILNPRARRRRKQDAEAGNESTAPTSAHAESDSLAVPMIASNSSAIVGETEKTNSGEVENMAVADTTVPRHGQAATDRKA
ncbi:hypothetical protein EIP91_003157 [Steccherinum ochraceum]|uniref:Uncharacterized protein n=1 Tax=Steccherinum ochraceum TaxID=92696 RepID=A0A4R0S4A0_9APHY|nr:hypothetical protein EIP91_003157 [Steccherinum ochraceum]